MAYNIEKQIIPGIPSMALSASNIVVAHEAGNPNNTGTDSLEREINVMRNNWGNAFVSHWVGGGGRIVQVAPAGKVQWGAGQYANNIAYAQVELARTSNAATFKKDYAAYVWLLRHLANQAGIPLTLDTGSNRGIKTHNWVTNNLGGTNHTDPYAYLASFGVTKAQFKKDVGAGTSKVSTPSKPKTGSTTTGKSIDKLADEVIAGKYGSGDARKKALGSKYNAVQKRVNEKLSGGKSTSKSIDKLVQETLAGKHGNGEARKKSLGSNYKAVMDVINGKAKKSGGKSIAQMAQEVIDGKHGSGHANRRRSLGISQAQYNKVKNEVNKRLGGGSSSGGKSVKQMADEIINGKGIPNGHEARRKHFGISKAKYEKVRAEVNRRL